MLSYRHGYHGGNFADVFKHLILVYLIEKLKIKKPFSFIDAFAGAGIYSTEDSFMQKNKEYLNGISKLLNVKTEIVLINKYLDLIKTFNKKEKFKIYPGSCSIASKLTDEKDKLYFSELHNKEFLNLENNFKNDKRVKLEKANSYQTLNKAISTYEGQRLVLIDPSYELKNEYEKVIKLTNHACKQFPEAVYLIWYPVLDTEKTKLFTDAFIKLNLKNTTQIHILLNNSFLRMQGTGFFLVNAPNNMNHEISTSLKTLLEILKEPNKLSSINFKNL
jgi:23S rRNA (adenine2030-N6)-methyltransferase